MESFLNAPCEVKHVSKVKYFKQESWISVFFPTLQHKDQFIFLLNHLKLQDIIHDVQRWIGGLQKKHYLNVESYSFMNALCGCS
jgi:hypothetical protein